MVWQDWVMSGAQCLFSLILLPTVLDEEQKPPFSTSILTAVVMFVLVGTYATLGLFLSPMVAFIVGLEWALIALQRYKINQGLPPPFVLSPAARKFITQICMCDF